MNTNDVITILSDLAGTCRDGQEVFRTAAENIRNSEFRRLFHILSRQRAQFVFELQAEVHRLGGEPQEGSSEAGLFDRAWTSLQAAVESGDEASIIGECQPVEAAAVTHYENALRADLPLEIQYVVKRQYMDIKDSFDRIRIVQRAA